MSRSTDSAFLDGTLVLLTSPYRRRVLFALSDRSPLTETAAAAAVSASEELDDDLDVLRLKLVHSHLPKLVGHGYVEWDLDTGVIRRGPNFEEVTPLLRSFGDPDPFADRARG